MTPPKEKPVSTLARTTITEARLRMVARDACFRCAGARRHVHIAPGLHVLATVQMDVVRKDKATALFRMNRGAVIAGINGLTDQRWWWPHIDAAAAVYAETVMVFK